MQKKKKKKKKKNVFTLATIFTVKMAAAVNVVIDRVDGLEAGL